MYNDLLEQVELKRKEMLPSQIIAAIPCIIGLVALVINPFAGIFFFIIGVALVLAWAYPASKRYKLFYKETIVNRLFSETFGQVNYIPEAGFSKEMISQMLIILGISIPLTTINTIMIHFYQSMKKIPLSSTLCILNNSVFVLLSAFVISKIIGINGVWLGLVSAEILTMITILIITSVKQKKLTTSVHDLIMLPKGFGIEKTDRLNISITKLSEISGVSQEIIDFCMSKGIDEKTSKACGLCMEELPGISMEKGKKNTVVDIYLTYKDGNIKLRLRDNGIPYKPEEINPQNESENNLGMRIVQGMAKNVNYSVVLGLNVFSLEL